MVSNLQYLIILLKIDTVKTCSHSSAAPNGRYFLIANNGNEVEMRVTVNITLNVNTTAIQMQLWF